MEVLDAFAADGVEADELIISHVGQTADPFREIDSLLRRGANFAFDRIGFRLFGEDDHWIRLIEHVARRGGLGRLMLSHDAGVVSHGLEAASAEGPWEDFSYIGRTFLPRLRRHTGLTEADVRTMTMTNPQRVLSFA